MQTISSPPTVPGATFRWGATLLAVFAVEVLDVLEAFSIRRVPGAAAWFEGIVSWRGQFVPVVNPSKRLGLPLPAAETPSRLAILSYCPSPEEAPWLVERFALMISRLEPEADAPAYCLSATEWLEPSSAPLARNSAC